MQCRLRSSQGEDEIRKKEYGTDLVLRNLADKSERTFSDVLEYTISKDAKTPRFAVSSKKEETNGAFAVTTSNADAPGSLAHRQRQVHKVYVG